MKTILKKFFILICSILFSLFIVEPLNVSAWGDNSGLPEMRPNYTKAGIDAGALGDKITFNSISDNSALGDGKNGNEKDFVHAREYNDPDTSHLWKGGNITVEDGKEYVVRMYVHNNSPKAYAGVAENTRVAFNVPEESAKSVRVTGYLTSSNATPTEYWDHVNFNSDTAFHLEYLGGTADISNKGVGKNGGAALSDEIVTNTQGVLIGYDALDGKIPGCFNYSSIVTIRVRAVYDTDYSVKTKARLVDDPDKNWKERIEVDIGDKIEFQINYTNNSKSIQRNVAIDAQLAANIKYISNTTKVYNGTYPKGFLVDSDEVVASGIYIGTYYPGANALIRFQAKVIDDESFAYGKYTLKNWGRASVGTNVVQDSASAIIEIKEKQTETFRILANIFSVLLVSNFIVTIILQYILYRLKK